MVNLLYLVFYPVLLFCHCISLLFKEYPKLFIQVCKALRLFSVLFDLRVLIHQLFSDILQVLITLLLYALHILDFFFESLNMLLGLFLLALHFYHLFLQLLILEHEKLILSIQLRNAIQSAIYLNTQRLGSLIDALIVLSGRLLGARF